MQDPNAPLYSAPPGGVGPNAPLMGNQYGSPATVPPPGMPNTIVVNQQSPAIIVSPDMFKLNPVSLTCHFCHKPVTTLVTQEFNCCACLLCFCTGLM